MRLPGFGWRIPLAAGVVLGSQNMCGHAFTRLCVFVFLGVGRVHASILGFMFRVNSSRRKLSCALLCRSGA
jgi:hypothetical protein